MKWEEGGLLTKIVHSPPHGREGQNINIYVYIDKFMQYILTKACIKINASGPAVTEIEGILIHLTSLRY